MLCTSAAGTNTLSVGRGNMVVVTNVLGRFSPATREWFGGAFSAPTAAQLGAWESIASGSHTLVVAPTGSGKTLSAFLWALDQLAAKDEGERRHQSPLHFAAQSAGCGRRAEPSRAAGRHHADGEASRPHSARDHRRCPFR